MTAVGGVSFSASCDVKPDICTSSWQSPSFECMRASFWLRFYVRQKAKASHGQCSKEPFASTLPLGAPSRAQAVCWQQPMCLSFLSLNRPLEPPLSIPCMPPKARRSRARMQAAAYRALGLWATIPLHPE